MKKANTREASPISVCGGNVENHREIRDNESMTSSTVRAVELFTRSLSLMLSMVFRVGTLNSEWVTCNVTRLFNEHKIKETKGRNRGLVQRLETPTKETTCVQDYSRY